MAIEMDWNEVALIHFKTETSQHKHLERDTQFLMREKHTQTQS